MLTQPRWTHVALPVSDLDRAIDFYTKLTPLVVVARNEDEQGRGAWLSNDKQVEDPFVLVIAEFVPEVAQRFGQNPGEPHATLAPSRTSVSSCRTGKTSTQWLTGRARWVA